MHLYVHFKLMPDKKMFFPKNIYEKTSSQYGLCVSATEGNIFVILPCNQQAIIKCPLCTRHFLKWSTFNISFNFTINIQGRYYYDFEDEEQTKRACWCCFTRKCQVSGSCAGISSLDRNITQIKAKKSQVTSCFMGNEISSKQYHTSDED